MLGDGGQQVCVKEITPCFITSLVTLCDVIDEQEAVRLSASCLPADL